MGQSVAKPHDRLFKFMLAQPDSARALLRERFGPEAAALLGASSVVALDTAFVDEDLGSTRTDKLLRVRLRPHAPEFLYCVVEHKSTPDHDTAAQMLGYLNSARARVGAARPRSRRHPPIWALVVYHGKRTWRAPLSYRELVDWPAGVPSRSGLDDHVELFDVGPIPDEALSADPVLRAGLMAMKYASRPAEQLGALPKILAAAAKAPRLHDVLGRYIQETFGSVDAKTLRRVAKRANPELEARMPTIASQLRAEARAEDLLLLLEKRFGPVPTAVTVRLKKASEADMQRWLIRVLDADSLREVFR